MQKTAQEHRQALTQLRMGLLGTLTAVIVCFATAYAFSGMPTQANTIQATEGPAALSTD